MTYMIEVLRQEHRNIEKVLQVLERELTVFDRGERPDYDVLLAVIDYFRDYPDSCHHPKEDLIVEKLKVRDVAAAATIGNLEAEHREGARRLHNVAMTIDAVLNDQELLRQSVHDIIRDFVDHERQHMAKEERLLFPAALNALSQADWSEIALKLDDRHDPLSAVEEKLSLLRRNISKLEGEAEASRRSASLTN